MDIPSSNYPLREPLFQEVFQSGVAPYIQTTGVDVFRLVTRRQLEENQALPGNRQAVPWRLPRRIWSVHERQALPNLCRGSGTLGFQSAPKPSYLIPYHFSGDAVMLDRVRHSGFQQQFSCDHGA